MVADEAFRALHMLIGDWKAGIVLAAIGRVPVARYVEEREEGTSFTHSFLNLASKLDMNLVDVYTAFDNLDSDVPFRVRESRDYRLEPSANVWIGRQRIVVALGNNPDYVEEILDSDSPRVDYLLGAPEDSMRYRDPFNGRRWEKFLMENGHSVPDVVAFAPFTPSVKPYGELVESELELFGEFREAIAAYPTAHSVLLSGFRARIDRLRKGEGA